MGIAKDSLREGVQGSSLANSKQQQAHESHDGELGEEAGENGACIWCCGIHQSIAGTVKGPA